MQPYPSSWGNYEDPWILEKIECANEFEKAQLKGNIYETCIKTQNFKSSKMDKKIDVNHLQDLKNVRKTIFNGSRTNLAHNRILKKKVAKFAKKY